LNAAFGGYVLNRSTPEQAAAWVRQAFEASVNHFDVAPEYGSAEEMMGPALEPYRKKTFPPADAGCLELAIKLASKFSPLEPAGIEAMKQRGLAAAPLFRFPGNG